MKQKLKQTSKKYLIIPIATLGLVAVLAFNNVGEAKAYEMKANGRGFAQAVAERFNLNQDKVEEVMRNFHGRDHEAREELMHEQMTQRLNQAVDNGKLSEFQRYAVLEKADEMHDKMEQIHEQDLSPDEMHEKMADMHEEMQSWAEKQGIDYEDFMREGRGMMRGGGRFMPQH